ncbi:hypothetical protein TIFTF001_002154 [Ficus carica]|uniref:Uncharacterized protein n=1 Tax=Ficus carica TaxID=3494 RepID=A0AA87ZSF4_FICCA|nr:hypothetical protein TIFTF001_002154 [Ficus carica]
MGKAAISAISPLSLPLLHCPDKKPRRWRKSPGPAGCRSCPCPGNVAVKLQPSPSYIRPSSLNRDRRRLRRQDATIFSYVTNIIVLSGGNLWNAHDLCITTANGRRPAQARTLEDSRIAIRIRLLRSLFVLVTVGAASRVLPDVAFSDGRWRRATIFSGDEFFGTKAAGGACRPAVAMVMVTVRGASICTFRWRYLNNGECATKGILGICVFN